MASSQSECNHAAFTLSIWPGPSMTGTPTCDSLRSLHDSRAHSHHRAVFSHVAPRTICLLLFACQGISLAAAVSIACDQLYLSCMSSPSNLLKISCRILARPSSSNPVPLSPPWVPIWSQKGSDSTHVPKHANNDPQPYNTESSIPQVPPVPELIAQGGFLRQG